MSLCGAASHRTAATAAQHVPLDSGCFQGVAGPHRASAAGQSPLDCKYQSGNINHTIALLGETLVTVDFPAGSDSFCGMFKRRVKLGLPERVRRLENLVLALVGKAKKMAEGQARVEQSFKTLQDGVTGLGQELHGKVRDMVAAHDQRDDQAFEAKAQELDEVVNQIRNLGHGGNTATKAGVSPTSTAGASTGDLPQGRGPIATQEPTPKSEPQAQKNENTGIAGAAGGQPRASGPQDKDGEHDVVVKGRDMP
jgi:hypothetical protein